jgi:hypothetical protein
LFTVARSEVFVVQNKNHAQNHDLKRGQYRHLEYEPGVAVLDPGGPEAIRDNVDRIHEVDEEERAEENIHIAFELWDLVTLEPFTHCTSKINVRCQQQGRNHSIQCWITNFIPVKQAEDLLTAALRVWKVACKVEIGAWVVEATDYWVVDRGYADPAPEYDHWRRKYSIVNVGYDGLGALFILRLKSKRKLEEGTDLVEAEEDASVGPREDTNLEKADIAYVVARIDVALHIIRVINQHRHNSYLAQDHRYCSNVNQNCDRSFISFLLNHVLPNVVARPYQQANLNRDLHCGDGDLDGALLVRHVGRAPVAESRVLCCCGARAIISFKLHS